ncbi:MAG: hypothetical protein WDW38_000426 [Sanguina aurantia]
MLSDQEQPPESSYSSPSLPGGLASELQQSQTSAGQQGTGTLMPANRSGSASFMSEGRTSKSSMPRMSSRKKDKQLEVSRSYKVETVSELEMNAFAVPNNSGPNLMSTAGSSERMSKDAQLMKWLDSSGPVNDSHTESGPPSPSLRTHPLVSLAALPFTAVRKLISRTPNPESDRLPLLSSLARSDPAGVVYAKLPPSGNSLVSPSHASMSTMFSPKSTLSQQRTASAKRLNVSHPEGDIHCGNTHTSRHAVARSFTVANAPTLSPDSDDEEYEERGSGGGAGSQAVRHSGSHLAAVSLRSFSPQFANRDSGIVFDSVPAGGLSSSKGRSTPAASKAQPPAAPAAINTGQHILRTRCERGVMCPVGLDAEPSAFVQQPATDPSQQPVPAPVTVPSVPPRPVTHRRPVTVPSVPPRPVTDRRPVTVPSVPPRPSTDHRPVTVPSVPPCPSTDRRPVTVPVVPPAVEEQPYLNSVLSSMVRDRSLSSAANSCGGDASSSQPSMKWALNPHQVHHQRNQLSASTPAPPVRAAPRPASALPPSPTTPTSPTSPTTSRSQSQLESSATLGGGLGQAQARPIPADGDTPAVAPPPPSASGDSQHPPDTGRQGRSGPMDSRANSAGSAFLKPPHMLPSLLPSHVMATESAGPVSHTHSPRVPAIELCLEGATQSSSHHFRVLPHPSPAEMLIPMPLSPVSSAAPTAPSGDDVTEPAAV